MVEVRDPYAGMEDLSSLPDKIADAKMAWMSKEQDRKREHARLYLTYKAKMAGQKCTQTELKSMVQVDPGYYKIALEAITAESEYIRLNEKLMAMKKMASLRASF